MGTDYNVEAVRANNNAIYCYGILTAKTISILDRQCGPEAEEPVSDACSASGIISDLLDRVRQRSKTQDLHDAWFSEVGMEGALAIIPILGHVVMEHPQYVQPMITVLSNPTFTALVDQTEAAIRESKVMSRKYFQGIADMGVDVSDARVEMLVNEPEQFLNWDTIPGYRKIELEFQTLHDQGFTMFPES